MLKFIPCLFIANLEFTSNWVPCIFICQAWYPCPREGWEGAIVFRKGVPSGSAGCFSSTRLLSWAGGWRVHWAGQRSGRPFWFLQEREAARPGGMLPGEQEREEGPGFTRTSQIQSWACDTWERLCGPLPTWSTFPRLAHRTGPTWGQLSLPGSIPVLVLHWGGGRSQSSGLQSPLACSSGALGFSKSVFWNNSKGEEVETLRGWY